MDAGTASIHCASAETNDFPTGGNMKTMKSVVLALLAMGVALTSGCGRHSKKEVYYLVGVNMALPYWQAGA